MTLEKAHIAFDEAMKSMERIAENSANMSLAEIIAEMANVQTKQHKIILYLFEELLKLKRGER